MDIRDILLDALNGHKVRTMLTDQCYRAGIKGVKLKDVRRWLVKLDESLADLPKRE